MIIKILDSETGDKSIVIFTNEDNTNLEFFLEGKFVINENNNFHEETRISISKNDCKILIGILQKWIK